MNNIGRDPKKLLIRTAVEAKAYRRQIRIIPAIVGLLVLLVAVLYIIAFLYSRYGSYTVSVAKLDNIDYSLALCEEANFNTSTSRLNTRASEDITNISVNDLPKNLDTVTGGIHSGDNFLAYTYYCKNVGSKTVNAEYWMYVVNVTQQLDTAIRIRLYVDGEPVTYMLPDSDGTVEKGTTAFASTTSVCRKNIINFHPGDMVRFTVVIWIEGDDIDCIDDRIGGILKVDMRISIIAVDVDGDGIVDADYDEDGRIITPKHDESNVSQASVSKDESTVTLKDESEVSAQSESETASQSESDVPESSAPPG